MLSTGDGCERECAWSRYWQNAAVVVIYFLAMRHTQRTTAWAVKGRIRHAFHCAEKHHREYDAGRKAFEKKYGLDMKAIAKEYYQAYGATGL